MHGLLRGSLPSAAGPVGGLAALLALAVPFALALHLLSGGAAPGAAAVALASAIGTAAIAGLALRAATADRPPRSVRREVTAAAAAITGGLLVIDWLLLAGQSGSGSSGCLPVLGRGAQWGASAALWRAEPGCAPGSLTAAGALAAAIAVLAALGVLLAHLIVAIGAGWAIHALRRAGSALIQALSASRAAGWVRRAVDAVRRWCALAGPAGPNPELDGAPAPRADVPAALTSLAHRTAPTRRGPPATAPA